MKFRSARAAAELERIKAIAEDPNNWQRLPDAEFDAQIQADLDSLKPRGGNRRQRLANAAEMRRRGWGQCQDFLNQRGPWKPAAAALEPPANNMSDPTPSPTDGNSDSGLENPS